MSDHVTRLAPSPTGALHLGNARTFLINWALARQQRWKIILRIEDLDTPRVKPQAREQAMEDFRWIGIDWDEGPYFQKDDLSPYVAAIEQLHSAGLIYSCSCSRTEIAQAQSAPNQGDHEQRYPGTCRARRGEVAAVISDMADSPASDSESASAHHALRICVPDEITTFTDMIAGPQAINVQQQVGDFVIATKANLPSYQLAVVVDDARQGITDIVRGDDLIPSAARQLWIYKYLNLTPLPRYWHLPLVIGEDGRRLAKRHGDTRLSWYRSQGVPAERIIGWIAHSCCMTASLSPMSVMEFVATFSAQRLPREQVIFAAQDHEWLLTG